MPIQIALMSASFVRAVDMSPWAMSLPSSLPVSSNCANNSSVLPRGIVVVVEAPGEEVVGVFAPLLYVVAQLLNRAIALRQRRADFFTVL
jgi:hypothetical protein